MPFLWGWALFGLLSLTLFFGAVHLVLKPVPLLWILIVFSPAVMVCLVLGQNSLIFASLMLLLVRSLDRGQVIVSGILLALLTLKPQIGLAIPFALVAAAQWRVIGAGIVATAVLVLATLIHPGPGYWATFFEAIHTNGKDFSETNMVRIMVTPFGSARSFGLEAHSAVLIHAAGPAVVLSLREMRDRQAAEPVAA